MASLLVPMLVFVLCLNTRIQSDYPSSVIGTQFALWKFHAFSLNHAGGLLVRSVDMGYYNGSWYSVISPGLSIVSMPFAVIGFILDGGKLNVFGNVFLMDDLFVATCAALAALATYRLCRLFTPPAPSLVGALALAFGTVVWPLATTPFIQDASLPLSVTSLWMVLTYSKVRKRGRYLLVGGFSLGVAFFIEYVVALFILPAVAYLAGRRARWSDIVTFVASSGVGLVGILTLNQVMFGNAVLFPEQLKGGVSSLWQRFDVVLIAQHALFYLVSPYRGVLLLSPFAAVGFYGLYRMGMAKETRAEAALFLALFATVTLTYSAWGDWAGGLAYGPRFLASGMPYLVVPSAIAIAESSKARLAFVPLFAASALIQGMGAITSAVSVAGGVWVYQPLALNLSWLVQGNYDVWWSEYIPKLYWPFSVVFPLILLAAVVTPVAILILRLPPLES